MFSVEHHRIPTHRNESSIDTARQGRREDIRNLEADKEGEGQDDGSILAVVIVRRVGEIEVEVGEQRTSVSNGKTAEREDGANQAFLRDS